MPCLVLQHGQILEVSDSILKRLQSISGMKFHSMEMEKE